MRSRTLTAYGTEDDQQKLAVLAEQSGDTASTWIVKKIQAEYRALFGDTPPQILRKPA